MQIIELLGHDDFSYSELEKGLTKTTPKMLSKELKDLEINGLVEIYWLKTPKRVTMGPRISW